MLFTHRGLSGPAILQISSYWQPGDDAAPRPAAGRRRFDAGCARSGRAARRGAAAPCSAERLPKRFAQRLCEHWLRAAEPLRQIPRRRPARLAATLADWPLVASGTEGYRKAEVTLGGVDTDELSSTTMQSKRVPGLYFIGEVVDVTGWLGGYNFQWAWASGHACGRAV